MKSIVLEFLKKLWEAKFIIVATMILTGILDLIGLANVKGTEIGLGFVI